MNDKAKTPSPELISSSEDSDGGKEATGSWELITDKEWEELQGTSTAKAPIKDEDRSYADVMACKATKGCSWESAVDAMSENLTAKTASSKMYRWQKIPERKEVLSKILKPRAALRSRGADGKATNETDNIKKIFMEVLNDEANKPLFRKWLDDLTRREEDA